MIRRPPKSTLFPYTTPSDLVRRDPRALPLVLRRARASPAAFGAARAPQRPVHAAHQRRHAPAEAVLPRPEIGEHTSELQSRQYLVCRLLLEKKKHTKITHIF